MSEAHSRRVRGLSAEQTPHPARIASAPPSPTRGEGRKKRHYRNAASNSSGASTIIMWPAPGNDDGARIRRRCRQRLAGLRGRHHVALAENEGRGHLDLRGSRERILIGVAGVEIVVEHARPRLLQHALRALMHPQSRREAAAEFGLEAEAPDRDHVDGIGIVELRGLEQIGPHRHRGGGADQAEAGNLVGMPRGRLQRDQRSHRMPDQLAPSARRPHRAARRSSRPCRRWSEAARRTSGRVPAGPAPARNSRDARTSGCAAPRSNDRSPRRAASRPPAATDRMDGRRWQRRHQHH